MKDIATRINAVNEVLNSIHAIYMATDDEFVRHQLRDVYAGLCQVKSELNRQFDNAMGLEEIF